ncbi:hypothetical protein pb186bvf_005352 [Paramecium bursaria]
MDYNLQFRKMRLLHNKNIKQIQYSLSYVKEHQLLCTLLIGNAFCMEALQIFIDIVTPALSIIISVIFIIYAEEINQILCTGPRLLEIAGRLTPLLKIIMILYQVNKINEYLSIDYHSLEQSRGRGIQCSNVCINLICINLLISKNLQLKSQIIEPLNLISEADVFKLYYLLMTIIEKCERIESQPECSKFFRGNTSKFKDGTKTVIIAYPAATKQVPFRIEQNQCANIIKAHLKRNMPLHNEGLVLGILGYTNPQIREHSGTSYQEPEKENKFLQLELLAMIRYLLKTNIGYNDLSKDGTAIKNKCRDKLCPINTQSIAGQFFQIFGSIAKNGKTQRSQGEEFKSFIKFMGQDEI